MIKTYYTAIRNATWVYYLIVLMFFVFAIQSFPVNGQGSKFLFIWWVAMAAGTAFGAGRNKRSAARKVKANLDVARG